LGTTAIVAEILIVGLQAAAWISLVLMSVFGTRWVHAAVQDSGTLVAVLVIAAAYVLGVIVDRLSDTAVRAVQGRGEKDSKPGTVGKKRLYVMAYGGEMGEFLEYQRSRLRIARATVFNMVFALPAAALFAMVRGNALTDPGRVRLLAAGVVFGVIAFVASLFAFLQVDRAFMKRLNEACEIVKEKNPELDVPIDG
jgi:hypothetical protein